MEAQMQIAKDYTAVNEGLRKFVRLIPLRLDPKEEKYILDEFDLLEALEVIRTKFHETVEMFGKKKYRDTPFDFCEDVREEMEEWLLGHEDPRQAALLRKKNQPMYHLVLAPVIDLFAKGTHAQALQQIDYVLGDIEYMVKNHEHQGTYDDAIIARAMISHEIHQKEERRVQKRTVRVKKQRRVLEEIAELNFE